MHGLEALYKMECEPLNLYRPCTRDQYDIHTSVKRQLIIPGGFRSAKTTTALTEFASRILGVPLQIPHCPVHRQREMIGRVADAAVLRGDYKPLREYLAATDTMSIAQRFNVPEPHFPRLYWIVGIHQRHVGQRLYAFLFKPGFFKLIHDLETGKPRIYNPADPVDAERESEMFGSEPLIPSRYVDETSWVYYKGGKKGDIFESVRLKNGATIRAYSSEAVPDTGDQIDGLAFDEDIANATWLTEGERRLLDRKGWMIWSVKGRRRNMALAKLMYRVKNKDKNIQQVTLRYSDNPFMDQDQRDWSDELAGSQEQIASLDHGDLGLDEMAMYNVDDETHGVGSPAVAASMERDVNAEGRARYLLSMIRRIERGEDVSKQDLLGQIWDEERCFPADWTRYLAIDPSNSRTAVIFGVVPPPNLYGFPMRRCVVVEKELVLKRASAKVLAPAIKEMVGNLQYEAFIMDKREGQKQQTGRDNTTFQHYAEAFAAVGLVSRLTQSSFVPGIDVPSYRWRIVREFVEGAKKGTPDLYYVRYGTPETQREFQSYRKAQQTNPDGELVVLDAPSVLTAQKHDCMAALEYLLAYLHGPFTMGQAYVDPKTVVVAEHEPGLPEMAQRIVAFNERQQASYDYNNF
jgi:hypothetical protein